MNNDLRIRLALAVIEEMGQAPGCEADAALILRYRSGSATAKDRQRVEDVAQLLAEDEAREVRFATAN